MTLKKRRKLNAFGMASDRKHIRIHRWLMDSPAWRSLSLGARCLLLEVWNRHNGANNGKISLSVREAMELLGCGRNTPTKWFKELQEKGFLVATRRGSFNLKSKHATEWRLTMEKCDETPPTREFKNWEPTKKKNIHSAVTLRVTDGHSERDRDLP